MNKAERVRRFHIGLDAGDLTLAAARAQLAQMALKQDDIPFLVQLVENPKYDLPGIELFHGATSLDQHDNIHFVLGRGLLAKDEAFVIGFTMGSTDRVSHAEEKLFTLFAKYLYPKQYRFDDEDVRVFRDAVRLGFISDSQSLAQVDFAPLQELPLREVRQRLGIEESLLRAYYEIERRRYPNSFESQRLLKTR